MDDPVNPLRDLLARNQENMAGGAFISLAWSACYSFFKRLAFREALMAGGAGSLFSATLWLFLSEWGHAQLYILFPVAVGCGVGAFPLMRAYTKKDDAIADDVVDIGGGIVARLLKRLGGKS